MKVVPFGTAMGRIGRAAPPRLRRRAVRRPLLRKALNRIVATLREWRQRSRERAQLATLDDRMLRDIGVNRGDVWREINKPFWRP
jgi:uncharacterized protein YjiS (DUF1127 family)